jgi:hypothetical protein
MQENIYYLHATNVWRHFFRRKAMLWILILDVDANKELGYEIQRYYYYFIYAQRWQFTRVSNK